MCQNRTKNKKINRLHERCFRLIYNGKKSSFEVLQEIDSSVSIHDVEIYKIFHGIPPTIINDIFTLRCHIKTNIILETGQILMFQKLELLIMKSRFGKLYQ